MAPEFDPRDLDLHRDYGSPEKRCADSHDPSDRSEAVLEHAFTRDLALPRGRDRELVRELDRDFRLNGSDVKVLSTIGVFRVVAEQDLIDSCYVRDADLRGLERQGLIDRALLNGDGRAVTLTDRGKKLLDRRREPKSEPHQTLYAGADRPRERSHDAEVYSAYLKAAERLDDRDARVVRVQLDRELRSDYQCFLQDRNRGDRNSDGRPDRTEAEIAAWAREHNLPYFDERVHFPDVRIEYEDANGDTRYEDIEVITEHYRGAHRASTARCGFSMHVTRRAGGGAFDPRVAEDFV